MILNKKAAKKLAEAFDEDEQWIEDFVLGALDELCEEFGVDTEVLDEL